MCERVRSVTPKPADTSRLAASDLHRCNKKPSGPGRDRRAARRADAERASEVRGVEPRDKTCRRTRTLSTGRDVGLAMRAPGLALWTDVPGQETTAAKSVAPRAKTRQCRRHGHAGSHLPRPR